jgi:hypothetical protein
MPKKSIMQNTLCLDTQRLSAVEIPTTALPITLPSSFPKVLTLLPAYLNQKDEGTIYGNLQISKLSLPPTANHKNILHPLHLSLFSFNSLTRFRVMTSLMGLTEHTHWLHHSR